MKTITELSVCALKDALIQGDVSAREAAQAYLSRIEERDKEIASLKERISQGPAHE